MRVRILQLRYIGSTDCDNSVSAEMFFLKRAETPASGTNTGDWILSRLASFVQALYTSLVFHSTTYSVSWAILFLTQEIGLLVLLF